MRLLIIFVLMLSNSFANDASNIKNLVINKELKNYSDITFLNIKNKELSLNDYKGNLVLLNFWATWCAPCKDEMPSLDLLAENPNLDNLKIFPINIGKDTSQKSLTFFEDLKIKNLEIYYNIRPSGTEPLLRVNLQYHKRNIKVNTLNKFGNKLSTVSATSVDTTCDLPSISVPSLSPK